MTSKSPQQLLASIDAFRERLAARGVWVTAEEVDRWIEEGRRWVVDSGATGDGRR